MPRERRNERPLPPAIIDTVLLEKINDSIPSSLREHITWHVGFGDQAVTEPTLVSLLNEIKNERRFDVLSLEVLDSANKDHEWLLWCDSDDSSISYNIAREREGAFQTLADDVEGLFKQNQRLRAKIPRMFRLWGFLKEPMFLIGDAPQPILSKLNWHRVAEDLVSRVVAHLLTLATGFGLGFLAGTLGGW